MPSVCTSKIPKSPYNIPPYTSSISYHTKAQNKRKFMFENVTKIDRAKLRHIAGDSREIPQEIQNMLSPDEETREEAIAFLLGEGQHPSRDDC
jgi:hypothetical protein